MTRSRSYIHEFDKIYINVIRIKNRNHPDNCIIQIHLNYIKSVYILFENIFPSRQQDIYFAVITKKLKDECLYKMQ